eukprot:3879906-Alexandrium_andersonii.AAC.1
MAPRLQRPSKKSALRRWSCPKLLRGLPEGRMLRWMARVPTAPSLREGVGSVAGRRMAQRWPLRT